MSSDGTARAGFDYEATEGKVEFSKGEITKQIRVTLLGDSVSEEDETATISIAAEPGDAEILKGKGF